MWPLPSIATRADIVALQRTMLPLATPMPAPLHFWLPGYYVRVLTLPKDSLVVGKIHRHAHDLCVLSGHALVLDPEWHEVYGGSHFRSEAGAKRAVYCYEDTTFMTIHKNPSGTRDLAAIEAEHILPEDAETAALMAEFTQRSTHDLGCTGRDSSQRRKRS